MGGDAEFGGPNSRKRGGRVPLLVPKVHTGQTPLTKHDLDLKTTWGGVFGGRTGVGKGTGESTGHKVGLT